MLIKISRAQSCSATQASAYWRRQRNRVVAMSKALAPSKGKDDLPSARELADQMRAQLEEITKPWE
jgi:hypothetical protein